MTIGIQEGVDRCKGRPSGECPIAAARVVQEDHVRGTTSGARYGELRSRTRRPLLETEDKMSLVRTS
jgi:hypothetical protein